eukprot:3855533-Rhodomonas_salina.6
MCGRVDQDPVRSLRAPHHRGQTRCVPPQGLRCAMPETEAAWLVAVQSPLYDTLGEVSSEFRRRKLQLCDVWP